MNTPISAVDVHSQDITLEALQEELRINPSRLEEKKGGNYWDQANSPLISLADFGNLQVCEFLLSVGANIDAKNTVCSIANSSSIENESVHVYQCFFW